MPGQEGLQPVVIETGAATKADRLGGVALASEASSVDNPGSPELLTALNEDQSNNRVLRGLGRIARGTGSIVREVGSFVRGASEGFIPMVEPIFHVTPDESASYPAAMQAQYRELRQAS